MREKLRFLATGDIHSDLDFLAQTKEINFKEIDYVLCIGDISDKIDDFKIILSHFPKPIIFVPGNHETKNQVDILTTQYNLHLLGNNSLFFEEGLGLFASNYISVGAYAKSEEEIYENLEQNFDKIASCPCKLMLNHIPAAESQLGNMSPFHPFIGGSFAIRSFLENHNIDLALCGHIHESSGLEEKIGESLALNVGRTFKIIEFDSSTKQLSIQKESL